MVMGVRHGMMVRDRCGPVCAGLALVVLIAAGCSNSDKHEPQPPANSSAHSPAHSAAKKPDGPNFEDILPPEARVTELAPAHAVTTTRPTSQPAPAIIE